MFGTQITLVQECEEQTFTGMYCQPRIGVDVENSSLHLPGHTPAAPAMRPART